MSKTDSISRQAAIDALISFFGLSVEEEYGSAIQDVLNGLPSVQPERWIPVSEGSPKKDGRYQVTRYDYVTNTEFIDILWYEKNLWWNGHSMGDYAVTAWMPLTEPYKGKQE